MANTDAETLPNLAAAIDRVKELAQSALKVEGRIHNITVQDKESSITVPVVVLPNGQPVALLDQVKGATAFAREERLRYAEGPDTRQGIAKFQSLESFTAHANRFKADSSVVWADAAARKLVSVLDYHPAGAASPARWGRHRGLYECPLSEAWMAWGGGQQQARSQADFASFLDAHDRELASGKLPTGKDAPDPATLISIAAKLEVYSTAKAKRERDPSTGRLSISYQEESGVSGDVIPPPSFLVRIPVFQDAEPMLLEVRLRVDVKDGKALFTYGIHAAGDVLREAFAMLCQRVLEETSLPVYQGTPEGQ